MQHDPDRMRARITIQAEGNRVAWADVARGLARAQGYDDSALEGVLPEGGFDITSAGWRRTRPWLNLALPRGVRFETERPRDGSPRLVITLDRAALLASERRFKALLRAAVLRPRSKTKQYGLMLPDGWEKAPAAQDLVVMVHGLDSCPERLETLAAAIRGAGLPCGRFRYPNDQAVADSARLLADELKRLARQHPDRGVALVTSSLGGLVARAAVENQELDPGNVRRLIMIAPPNHGSALARLAFASDIWEHVAHEDRRSQARRLYALVEDGLCEATDDLEPGSPFLRKLNAGRRNPKVRCAILLGTFGPLQPEDLVGLRARISELGQRSRWVRFLGPRIEEWLADLDEVLEGKGDGVVSVARGRLEGVDDTLLLRFSHGHAGPDAQKLVEEILRRLRGPGR